MNLALSLASDFIKLDQCIHYQLRSDVDLIQQVASYIVQAGGKRMRPALLILAADALGLREDKRIIQLATVIEFIHTATLLHDDVVDESDQRRGKQTANALFGNPASVLVGDFLYSRAFQMMVSLNCPDIMSVLADTTNTIAEGEVLQLMHIGDIHLTEQQYLHVIEYKTAKLFEAAARLPAVLIHDNKADIALSIYGRKMGSAFQIVDDILDYQGDAAVLGKNLGDDLREGKVTLPLIYAMQYASDTDRIFISKTIHAMQNNASHLNNDNSFNNSNDLAKIMAIIQSSGAIDWSMQTAKKLVNEALSALNSLEHLTSKHAINTLYDLAQQAIDRSY